MKLYNTLTRKKEEFISLKKGKVGIYSCGPTVYNYIHIGNARPICVFDVLRNYFEYKGYKVNFVQNYTDIDDKIINKANQENSDYLTVSEKFIEEYEKDARGLNVREATFHPKATENIEQIKDIIKSLVDNGYAYRSENGDIYFRALKFKEYGKLSHQPIEDLQSGARIRVGEQKENPMDFAVWKGAKKGEPMWKSEWGNGRPGWHIECSAMAKRYLGDTIDIHCGGQDLIFPHHENEIAQSECSTGKPFARYWLHNGYINIDNKKMSKSLGNFFTVRDIAEKFGYEPIRYLMIASHYRSPINFSMDLLEQATNALERLYNCKENLIFKLKNCEVDSAETDEETEKRLLIHKDAFIEAMEDDLNTADALAAVFELVRDINSYVVSKERPSKAILEFSLGLFSELSGVLGLVYEDKQESIDEEIEQLIEKRQQARKDRDFAAADKLRDELKAKGIALEDTADGVKWSKI